MPNNATTIGYSIPLLGGALGSIEDTIHVIRKDVESGFYIEVLRVNPERTGRSHLIYQIGNDKDARQGRRSVAAIFPVLQNADGGEPMWNLVRWADQLGSDGWFRAVGQQQVGTVGTQSVPTRYKALGAAHAEAMAITYAEALRLANDDAATRQAYATANARLEGFANGLTEVHYRGVSEYDSAGACGAGEINREDV